MSKSNQRGVTEHDETQLFEIYDVTKHVWDKISLSERRKDSIIGSQRQMYLKVSYATFDKTA